MNAKFIQTGAFFFSLMLLILSCEHEGISEEDQLIAEILCKSADFLEKRYDMRLIGTDMGGPDGLNYLGMDFLVYRGELKKEEVRVILVGSVQTFLDFINQEEKLMLYTDNYPFELKNIAIRLFFYCEDGEDVIHPGIGCAFLDCSQLLSYETLDVNCHRVSVEKERFEDVVRIVEEIRDGERRVER
jgi:hypothetical protein